MSIRNYASADLSTVAMLVSESNKSVATMFGLNADNCPKHPSLCTQSWVEAELRCTVNSGHACFRPPVVVC